MSDICPVTLYHGTSSIFLPSILEYGLGGINAVKEWGILDLAREIFPYVEELHVAKTAHFDDMNEFDSFKKMVNQEIVSSAFNFQHGDVYVSMSPKKSVEYTAKKRWGSEILTYTLKYLQRLVDIDYKNIRGEMYHKYQNLYRLLRIYASPLLVEIKGLSFDDLLDEDGSTIDSKKKEGVKRLLSICSDDNRDEILQGCNFRLKKVIAKENLKISLIGVKKVGNFELDYDLYPLDV